MARDPRDNPSNQKKRSSQWKLNQKHGGKGSIESNQAGIFVTCPKNQESRCMSEMQDILSQELEGYIRLSEAGDAASDGDDDDIEAQIRKEVDGMKPKNSKLPFHAIKLDMPCVIFIRLDKTLDPVQIVRKICEDAQANPEKKRTRKVQRMTPITLTRKILSGGLEALSREVLKPHFHSGGPPKKYAVRPTIRQNAEWHKDTVAKVVANVVGPEHPVDLKNYDVLVLVEVMRNICAMSVVGRDYDQLKKYNISELYSPTPKKVDQAPAPAPAAAPAPAPATKEEKAESEKVEQTMI